MHSICAYCWLLEQKPHSNGFHNEKHRRVSTEKTADFFYIITFSSSMVPSNRKNKNSFPSNTYPHIDIKILLIYTSYYIQLVGYHGHDQWGWQVALMAFCPLPNSHLTAYSNSLSAPSLANTYKKHLPQLQQKKETAQILGALPL